MRKAVDKVRTEHFYPGKLICHLVKAVGQLLKFFWVFEVDFCVEVPAGHGVYRVYKLVDRAKRETAQCQSQDYSNTNADETGLYEERDLRCIRTSGKYAGIYGNDNNPVADKHSQKKKNKNESGTEQYNSYI